MSRLRRGWSGLPRRYWMALGLVLAAGIALAVAADHVIDALSSARPVGGGRIVRCGRPGAPVSVLARRLTADLDDGRRVSISRHPAGRPSCGARIAVDERTTPWGGVWYAIPAEDHTP